MPVHKACAHVHSRLCTTRELPPQLPAVQRTRDATMHHVCIARSILRAYLAYIARGFSSSRIAGSIPLLYRFCSFQTVWASLGQ